ncbi:MAG: ATP-binding protein, partial [Bacteroidota bacterium]
MKIEIQNLGPIHRFEFDLEKDLHLLYGENNVGKSFATNILFCILKAMSETDPLKMRAYFQSDMVAEPAGAGYHVKDENWKDIVNNAGKAFFEKIFEDAKRYVSNTYATLSNASGDLGQLIIKASDKKNSLHIVLNEAMKIIEFDFQFADFNPDANAEIFPQTRVHNALQVIQRLLWKDVYQVYYLPTFRSGVYQSLSNMGALFAKLSTQRILLNGNFDLPGYGAPVADFYLKLMGQYETYPAGKIATTGLRIEKNILHGEV